MDDYDPEDQIDVMDDDGDSDPDPDPIVPATNIRNAIKLKRLALHAFTLSPEQKPIHFYSGQLNGVPPCLVAAIYKKVSRNGIAFKNSN